MEKRKRTRTEEPILDEPADKSVTVPPWPKDVHLNLTDYGDIYIKRNNTVYKLNIDNFLKELDCLAQVAFNDEEDSE